MWVLLARFKKERATSLLPLANLKARCLGWTKMKVIGPPYNYFTLFYDVATTPKWLGALVYITTYLPFTVPKKPLATRDNLTPPTPVHNKRIKARTQNTAKKAPGSPSDSN